MAPWPPDAEKFGVVLEAVSWHFAGDGPVVVLLDVDPQSIDAAIAIATVRRWRARRILV